jgi:hypothetical protein
MFFPEPLQRAGGFVDRQRDRARWQRALFGVSGCEAVVKPQALDVVGERRAHAANASDHSDIIAELWASAKEARAMDIGES